MIRVTASRTLLGVDVVGPGCRHRIGPLHGPIGLRGPVEPAPERARVRRRRAQALPSPTSGLPSISALWRYGDVAHLRH